MKRKTRRPPAIKVMMMPKDTNPHGVIFGGVLLSYIDQAGAIHANDVAEKEDSTTKLVTVAMDRIEFKEPVLVGDVVSFYVSTITTGKSSITVQVDAFADSDRFAERFVTKAILVFVAVDKDNSPVNVFDRHYV